MLGRTSPDEIPDGALVWAALADQEIVGAYLIQDGRFRYVNRRYAGIFGYTPEEILAMTSVDGVVHPDDRPKVTENIRRRVAGEIDQVRYSFKGLRRDGSPCEVEAQGRRVLFGAHPAVLGVLVDVSERAREERTYHQRQKAEALGAMSAGVAHDFRNILAVIQTTAEFLAPHLQGDPMALQDLDDLRDAVRRGTALCQQLMAFGRPVREGEQHAASVREVARDLEPTLVRLLRPRVELVVDIPEDLPRVRVTPAELEQVLMNLVLNARDATHGRGSVWVSATATHTRDPAEVLVQVRDEGTGIHEDNLQRIFEPYFTTKGDAGTGLGLRNVWRIVTASAGTVRVDSKLGAGSTFTVCLPVERRARPRDQGPRAA